jgi:phage shock protein C
MERGMAMARLNDRYSMNRRDKKLAGVCSTIGEVFNLDPTFIRVGFVAAAILVSWKLALIAYVGAGIYLAIQRNNANRSVDRSRTSEYDRMEDVTRVRPTTHALRTQLDDTDRRLMAIDDHINSTNDELAREIEALREEK